MTRTLQLYGRLSILALAIAAWTGVLLRFGLAGAMPTWVGDFSAIRHAHSHLMYFGWVTLALMALIWYRLPAITGRPLPWAAVWQLAATTVAAFLSFPAFWINGYGLTTIGTSALPLGSMASSICGLTWFWFLALYMRETRQLPQRAISIQLWDWSLVLLLIACAGAVGLVVMVFTGSESILLQLLFLHLFLDLFAAGWFALAILGLLWDLFGDDLSGGGLSGNVRLPVMTLALALVPTFVLGMLPSIVPPALATLGLIANAIAAVLFGWHFVYLWPHRRQLTWFGRFGLVMFGLYILGALVLSLPSVWRWQAGTQLRVYYLHLFLLGWISSIVLDLLLQHTGWGSQRIVRTLAILWIAGVSTMLLALLGIGLIGWSPFSMIQLLNIAAWASILPALAATVMLLLKPIR